MKNQNEIEDLGICVRCKKNKATLSYTNSQMDFIHGFTEKICQGCYDKIKYNSAWFKEGKKETINLIKDIIENKDNKINHLSKDKFNKGYVRALNDVKEELKCNKE